VPSVAVLTVLRVRIVFAKALVTRQVPVHVRVVTRVTLRLSGTRIYLFNAALLACLVLPLLDAPFFCPHRRQAALAHLLSHSPLLVSVIFFVAMSRHDDAVVYLRFVFEAF
jgi:hypothetical protein